MKRNKEILKQPIICELYDKHVKREEIKYYDDLFEVHLSVDIRTTTYEVEMLLRCIRNGIKQVLRKEVAKRNEMGKPKSI